MIGYEFCDHLTSIRLTKLALALALLLALPVHGQENNPSSVLDIVASGRLNSLEQQVRAVGYEVDTLNSKHDLLIAKYEYYLKQGDEARSSIWETAHNQINNIIILSLSSIGVIAAFVFWFVNVRFNNNAQVLTTRLAELNKKVEEFDNEFGDLANTASKNSERITTTTENSKRQNRVNQLRDEIVRLVLKDYANDMYEALSHDSPPLQKSLGQKSLRRMRDRIYILLSLLSPDEDVFRQGFHQCEADMEDKTLVQKIITDLLDVDANIKPERRRELEELRLRVGDA